MLPYSRGSNRRPCNQPASKSGLFFDPKYERNTRTFLRNIGKLLQECTASHPISQYPPWAPPWELQTQQNGVLSRIFAPKRGKRQEVLPLLISSFNSAVTAYLYRAPHFIPELVTFHLWPLLFWYHPFPGHRLVHQTDIKPLQLERHLTRWQCVNSLSFLLQNIWRLIKQTHIHTEKRTIKSHERLLSVETEQFRNQ
jgi:hypothetical protein